MPITQPRHTYGVSLRQMARVWIEINILNLNLEVELKALLFHAIVCIHLRLGARQIGL